MPALPVSAMPSVQLTASLDLIGPWVDVFNTASANATEIFDAIKDADFGFPSSLQEAFAAVTFLGVDIATPEGSELAAQTLDWSHLWGLQYLAGMDMGMGSCR